MISGKAAQPAFSHDRRFPWILAFLVLASYGNTFRGSFVYDDVAIVEHNPRLINARQAFKSFLLPYFETLEPDAAAHGLMYRPIPILSFWVNKVFFGMHPAGFHVVNVFLHFLVCLALWHLAKRFGLSPLAASLCAICFAVMPIHTEVVANITGRTELLACLFGLLAWSMSYQEDRPMRVSAAIILFLLGMLSKESAVAFIPALVLTELATRPLDISSRIKSRFPIWIMLLMAFLVYFEWRHLILKSFLDSGGETYFHGNPVLRILTMSKFFFCHYLAPSVGGIGLSADWSHPAIPSATYSAGSFLWFVALLVLGVWSFYKTIMKRRIGWFGVSLFFIFLFPVSNLITLLEVIGADRFLYTPSVGLCLCSGILLARYWERRGTKIIFVSMIIFWMGLTIRRNEVWATPLSLWSATVRDSPRSALAWNRLGLALREVGRAEAAIAAFHQSLELDSSQVDPVYNLGETYFQLHQWDRAKLFFIRALGAGTDPDTLVYLAVLEEQHGQPSKAIAYYEQLLRVHPDHGVALRNLGLLELRTGRITEARIQLVHYLQTTPSEEDAEPIRHLLQIH